MRLTDKLPLNEEFEFEGSNFCINLAFNNVIRIYEVLEDQDLDSLSKVQVCLTLLLEDDIFNDDDLVDEEWVKYMSRLFKFVTSKFIVSGENDVEPLVDIGGNPLPQEIMELERKYSFVKDAEYIYASFFQAYKMDLFEEHDDLHWNKFLALFNSLPSDTKIMQIINIRSRELPKDPKEREAILKAKRFYALTREEEDNE